MGHLHYIVRDVEANKKFWIALGGISTTFGTTEVVKFPDVLVLLSQGDSSGGTEGSVVNHVAFRVRSLAPLEAAGMKVQHLKEFPGVASVYTPEGERIELFDEGRATNLGFTFDSGHPDPVADRHNQKMNVPIIAHHIHLYVPETAVQEAKAWYVKMFGGVAGKRWRYDATDLPGINFNFSAAPRPNSPTKGRMLDHIGFEVENLETFCRRLASNGVKFDVPYNRSPNGFGSAWLTDPWGTSIELTEGLRGL
jgi:catechol 2,3-dioxygenase-like lactoylglutathione lyase family enzyme